MGQTTRKSKKQAREERSEEEARNARTLRGEKIGLSGVEAGWSDRATPL